MGDHKLRIKIGDAEFEAEGSEDSVKDQFNAFLAALAATPAKPAAKEPSPETPGNSDRPQVEPVDRDLLDRAFLVGKDVISLKFLPKGENREADALLLLIYGYQTLRGDDMVLGTQITRAARVSGLTLDRIDRPLAKHDTFLLKGGARKGMKYGLNNPGKLKAVELLKKLEA